MKAYVASYADSDGGSEEFLGLFLNKANAIEFCNKTHGKPLEWERSNVKPILWADDYDHKFYIIRERIIEDSE